MKRLSYIVLSLAIAVAFSCTKQERGNVSVPGGEIRFSPGLDASLISKAETENPYDKDDFAVYGWNTGSTSWTSSTSTGEVIFNNEKTVKSSGSYITVNKEYWGEGKYHFVAYGPYRESSPASFEGAGSSFKLKFTDYTTTTSVTDLVYSEFATDKTKGETKGTVALKFHHALSRIIFTFTVKDENKMNDSGGDEKEITIEPISISFQNFLTKGSFSFDGTTPSWTGVSEKGNITNSGVVESESGYDAYVLPQTLGGDASFSLTYNIVFSSGDSKVTAGPFTKNNVQFSSGTGGTWTELEMNKQYIVQVMVNAYNSEEIVIGSVTKEDWETASGTISTK